MRKLVIGLVLLSVVGGQMPVGAEPRTDRIASAFILLPKKGGSQVRPFLAVWASERTLQHRTISVSRGRCLGDSIPEDCVIPAEGGVYARSLSEGETFEIDADLSSARLAISYRGKALLAQWSATGALSSLPPRYDCGLIPDEEDGRIIIGRKAAASIELGDDELHAGGESEGYGFLSASAYAC